MRSTIFIVPLVVALACGDSEYPGSTSQGSTGSSGTVGGPTMGPGTFDPTEAENLCASEELTACAYEAQFVSGECALECVGDAYTCGQELCLVGCKLAYYEDYAACFEVWSDPRECPNPSVPCFSSCTSDYKACLSNLCNASGAMIPAGCTDQRLRCEAVC